MATPVTPLVVYIARESSGAGQRRAEIFQFLLESLHYIQSQHNTTYDSDGWQPPMFFTYIYPANNIWVSQANHTLFMFEVIAEAQQKGCSLILVLSGWAGLTTSPVMLDHILRWFDDAGVVVHIRVFAEVSRHFFDINV
ncbi:hypothetical protein N7465_001433 [Penicillium sp. CMV-2018d]|nr:hypothetical protein N7465_001433 [Penicillium sp. CMV-2018d]